MKDVRAPVVIDPFMVRLAPYITTITTDNVDAAVSPPEKRPTTFWQGVQNSLFRTTISLSYY